MSENFWNALTDKYNMTILTAELARMIKRSL